MNELSLFNRILDSMYETHEFPFTASTIPEADITQTKEAYNIEMDLPGLNQDEINVELNQNVLTISSKQEETKTDKDSESKTETVKWLLKERSLKNFARSFTLPKDIDGQNITASFKNGVLNVKIARKALEEPKRIAINVA